MTCRTGAASCATGVPLDDFEQLIQAERLGEVPVGVDLTCPAIGASADGDDASLRHGDLGLPSRQTCAVDLAAQVATRRPATRT